MIIITAGLSGKVGGCQSRIVEFEPDLFLSNVKMLIIHQAGSSIKISLDRIRQAPKIAASSKQVALS